jgi:hypothetical protein
MAFFSRFISPRQTIHGLLLLPAMWLLLALSIPAADVWLTGDFDGDGASEEARISDAGLVYCYLSSGKINNFQLVNSSGAQLRGDWLKFILCGDFDHDGKDELRGLMSNTQWQDIWKLDGNPRWVWGNYLFATPGSYDPATSPKVNVNDLRHVVAGDFNNDGYCELWGLLAGTTQTRAYLWGYSTSPSSLTLANRILLTSAGANVVANNLLFPSVAKFTVTTSAQFLALDSATNNYHIWNASAANAVQSALLKSYTGTTVAVSGLKYVLPVDLDADGKAEWWGITAASNTDYAWKSGTANAIRQGALTNASSASVTGNMLDRATIIPNGASSTLRGIQGVTNWSGWRYDWTWASSTTHNLSDGPVSNHNDFADLATETPRNCQYTGGDVREKPLALASYFTLFSGPEREITGNPVKAYTPADLSHQVGAWHNAQTHDYWLVQGTGTPGLALSYGPYVNPDPLRTALGMGGAGDRLDFKVEYELQVASNAFSSTKVATIDVFCYDTVTSAWVLFRQRNLYPQDFLAANTWQAFSFVWPDYLTANMQQLQFRVIWNGTQTLAIRNTTVKACDFAAIFGGWDALQSSGSWNAAFYREFDPGFILTCDYSSKSPLTMAARASIDPWRRDIGLGHTGQYPYIGPYDLLTSSSTRNELLRYQIRQAKAAGLDGFKVYTYYASRAGDTALLSWDACANVVQALLQVAAEEGGFGIVVEDSNTEYIKSGVYTHADALNNLRLAARAGWLDHPGYLRVNGRPVYALPFSNQTPTSITTTITRMNTAYRQERGAAKKDLFSLVCNVVTWGETNPTGPCNQQETFLVDESNNMWTYRADWFVCSPAATSIADLIARGKCLYDQTQPVSGYGALLATLLAHNPTYRNLPGVTSFYDFDAGAAMLVPQYVRTNSATLGGTPDATTAKKLFQALCTDAHQYQSAATATLAAGHDKRGLWTDVHYELIPRYESPSLGQSLRFSRILPSALAAHPDVINIENWNGYQEGKAIEPCEGNFADDGTTSDPDIFLRKLAYSLGRPAYDPALISIPTQIIDPLREPYIPTARKKSTPVELSIFILD